MSVTPPQNESHRAAMEFDIWKWIGKDFLIKSNVNNWVSCEAGSSDITILADGSIICKLVKVVNPACTTVPGTNKSNVKQDTNLWLALECHMRNCNAKIYFVLNNL